MTSAMTSTAEVTSASMASAAKVTSATMETAYSAVPEAAGLSTHMAGSTEVTAWPTYMAAADDRPPPAMPAVATAPPETTPPRIATPIPTSAVPA
jgi:hypothetical protein